MADDRIPVPAAGASGILDPLAPAVGYFFSGPQGTPSYPELERRRQLMLARAAAAKRGFPTTLGQGITSLGEAIGERIENNQLTAQERAFETTEGQRAKEITGQPGVGTSGPARAPAGRPNSAELIDPAARATRDRIAALGPDALGVAQENPTSPGVDTPPVMAVGSPEILANRSGIAGIETGGGRDPYRMLGAITPKGDRAYGKYQIMGANIPEWSEAALGQRLTPQQFLANDKAQDTIFDHRFGNYVNQYGQEGAARAWYGGERGMNNLGKTDQHGRLNVLGYGRQYLRNRGGAQPSGDPGEAGDDVGSTMTIDSATGAEPNPITPTTLRPMPRASFGAGTRETDRTLPSQTAVPPQTEQTMDPPGAEPTPPPRVDFSPRQMKALEVMNNRAVSPQLKEFAKQQFEIEEKIRSELTARREADYTHQRQRWEKHDDEYKKFVLEAPKRNIEMLIQRGQFEKAQADLEEMYYKRGLPREQAEQKAALDIQQLRRTVSKPEHLDVAGTRYQSDYDPAKGTYSPYSVAPGAPAPEEKSMTETEAKAVTFVLRSHKDLAALEGPSMNGKALTNATEHAIQHAPMVPGAITNRLLSDDYRRQRDAFGNWGAGFLNYVSGATVTPSEALIQLPAFMPRPGDSDKDLADKAQRRLDYTNAVQRASGARGKAAIKAELESTNADYAFREEGKKEPVRPATPTEAATLPPGRRIILPDGTIGTVPRR